MSGVSQQLNQILTEINNLTTIASGRLLNILKKAKFQLGVFAANAGQLARLSDIYLKNPTEANKNALIAQAAKELR
jgi:hypothetical protein